MIIQCNYEELRALRAGAEVVLEPEPVEACAVAAPAAERERVQALVPALDGDLSVATLAEQQEMEEAVRTIVACLRAEMDAAVLAEHPAAELAVSAYFDYAHGLTVLERLEEMGDYMRALIEVVSGAPATAGLAASFSFPD